MIDSEDTSSVEKKIEIVKNFLLDAPAGEFNEVLNDLRVLLDNDDLLYTECLDAFAKHNEEYFLPLTFESNTNPFLITEWGRFSTDQYIDPCSKTIIKVDHLQRTAISSEIWEYDQTIEPFRQALEDAVFKYTSAYFCDGATSVYAQQLDDEEHLRLIVCIHGQRLNPSNYWNGRWRSQWTILINRQDAAEKGSMEGWMKVDVHYYEDGNVQLGSSSKRQEASFSSGNPEEIARDFVGLLEKAESEYQKEISESFTLLSDNIFRSLRRQLPVTRTKLDWSKILNYKVGQELSTKT
eukprot:Sdes_comp20125_c0_seq1m13176